jgi:hypothetical protein
VLASSGNKIVSAQRAHYNNYKRGMIGIYQKGKAVAARLTTLKEIKARAYTDLSRSVRGRQSKAKQAVHEEVSQYPEA